MTISTVVPIYNEEENLPELRRRLTAALDLTGRSWELIFVNDGSRDSSAALIRRYAAEDPRVKLVDFSRNFGHQPAVTAGIHYAQGDCVILMDGDLQDPPEIIPQLVDKWREGFQVVKAERHSRAEGGVRGLGFRLFYPLLSHISELPQGEQVGIFGLMDRRVVDEFNKLPERNRFIPGLRTWLGFSQTSVFYDRQERAAGEPKQTLSRLIKYALDAMISFSNKPLRLATYAGAIISIVAFVLVIVYLLAYFLQTTPPPRGFTSILLAVLFLGGVQLLCLGILGEYIGRIYEETKQRPLYVVREAVGISPAASPELWTAKAMTRAATASAGEPVVAGWEE